MIPLQYIMLFGGYLTVYDEARDLKRRMLRSSPVMSHFFSIAEFTPKKPLSTINLYDFFKKHESYVSYTETTAPPELLF